MPAPAPYHVSAYNTAKASENKIHDDATARRFGFTGGLVGGVHVYAYMTHLPVQHWGRAWLERGTGDCKFGKPVYEGDIAEITADEDGRRPGADGAQPRRAVRHRIGGVAVRRHRACPGRLPVSDTAGARRSSAADEHSLAGRRVARHDSAGWSRRSFMRRI